MKSSIEDFETGWYGMKLRLDISDIDKLIEYLQLLKKDDKYHFHMFSSAFEEDSGGVADIEFSRKTDSEISNMEIGA